MFIHRGPSLRLVFAGLAFAFAAPGPVAMAQQPAAETQPLLASPVEDLKKQMGEVKGNIEALNQKIDESAKQFDTLTDPEAARKELEKLRETVSAALAAVAGNGNAAKLGAKAQAFAENKLSQLERESKYAREDKDLLLGEWRRIVSETRSATDDLNNAAKEFSQLLRTVQTRQDFIGELQQIDNAKRMLEVIRQLAGDIRNSSEQLKGFIRRIGQPGT